MPNRKPVNRVKVIERYKNYRLQEEPTVTAQIIMRLMDGEALSEAKITAEHQGLHRSLLGVVVKEMRRVGFQIGMTHGEYSVVKFPDDWDNPTETPARKPRRTSKIRTVGDRAVGERAKVPVPPRFYPMLKTKLEVVALTSLGEDVVMTLVDDHGAVWRVMLLDEERG